MKVLLYHSLPFSLAHGGTQTQIEQTKAALEKIGVEVEFLRWWDEHQKADIIHYVGRPGGTFVQFAQRKKIRVISAELMGGLGVRPAALHLLHKLGVAFSKNFLPKMVAAKMGWDTFQIADAFIALTSWEAHLLTYVFGAPASRVHIIPNGVEDVFFEAAERPRGEWLVCTSTIRDIKRPLELAMTAVEARTPLWIIGRPYSEDDPYWHAFREFAGRHRGVIRYEGGVSDRTELARIYREARGFVMLSSYETLSLSALEAAACECPLLLSDRPWAHSAFADAARYCPITRDVATTAKCLREFYDAAPTLPPPPKPKTWIEVAQQLKGIYEELLSAGPISARNQGGVAVCPRL